tara:strand:+ start:1161 stop:1562 length:402 start_codon:yes stop_codon:yes gene_type:complete
MSHFDIPHKAWVVVADGEKALFLYNEGDEVYPHLKVFREEHQDNPPNREQAANRPGRFNDGPGPHRSAVDDTDWHKLEKTRFAHELSDISIGRHTNTASIISSLSRRPQRLVIFATSSIWKSLRKSSARLIKR